MLRSFFAPVFCLSLLFAMEARADGIRLHGTAAGARALGGHQADEFPWGVGALGAAELPLIPQLGAELELGTLFLFEGDEPADPAIEPEGGVHALFGAVGVHVRPFVKEDRSDISGATGIWASANFGATTTGGRGRALFDVHAGYDFLFEGGKYGIGPTLGLVHVFQSDDSIRPADANIFLFGVHLLFDTADRVPRDVDTDRDGIVDRLDKCPTDPEDKDGFEDEDGCPELDNDKDGIVDAADHCPLVPEDKDGFEDEDGCPEEDNDKDGILDKDDKCPNEPEDKDGFEDEDGCPEPDNDQDGILDADDLCPNEPETKNGYADHDGCPDEDQIRVVGDKIVMDDHVHFRTNNATIRPQSYPLLKRLAKLLVEHPEYVHIEVQGHTDDRGTEEFNQKLSEDRAASVLEFLVKHGVERDRLSSKGFGDTKPITDEKTEYALFLNRRVELLITRVSPDDAKKLKEHGKSVEDIEVRDPPAEGESL